MGETETLAAAVAGVEYDDLTADAVSAAKRAIRDYAGVALYGSGHPVGDRIASHVKRCMPGDGATLVGGDSASPTGAALANGTFGHAVDYDDTFESIVLHPTSPVFPAALAAGEVAAVSARDVLVGYVAGVETAFRVGHATYPAHYEHGWHATGTIGSFGAAAGAGAVLGLSVGELRHALGIVASGASSLKRNFGSMTKPLHAGHAAEVGLRAALLAREGFTADGSVLDGALGYGAVMTPDGSYDPAEIDRFGDDWAVTDVGLKPYPSGVITHAAMEALREIRADEGLSPDDVARIEATLDEAAAEMLIHAAPETALEAKFSIEFCLAAILREGSAGVREFTDGYVADPETRALMERVERAYEPGLFDDEFAGYGARVVVETRDGRRFEAERPRAPGSPSDPLPEDRAVEKFHECATATVSRDAADDVLDAVSDLDGTDPIARLASALRGG